MNHGQYLAVDVEKCRRDGHHFKVTGSDKTPMKRSLLCVTCSERNPGKSAFAAYGIDTQGFGT